MKIQEGRWRERAVRRKRRQWLRGSCSGAEHPAADDPHGQRNGRGRCHKAPGDQLLFPLALDAGENLIVYFRQSRRYWKLTKTSKSMIKIGHGILLLRGDYTHPAS